MKTPENNPHKIPKSPNIYISDITFLSHRMNLMSRKTEALTLHSFTELLTLQLDMTRPDEAQQSARPQLRNCP